MSSYYRELHQSSHLIFTQHRGVAIIILVLLMKLLKHKVVVRPGRSHMAGECWADVKALWSDHRIFAPDPGGGEGVCLRVADSGFLSRFLSPLLFSSLGTRDI